MSETALPAPECRPVRVRLQAALMAAVTVYTAPYCSFCYAVKRLLERAGVDYEEISLEGRANLRRSLSEANQGWRTVPMVFVGERFIGGFVETRALLEAGELVGLAHAMDDGT